MNDQEKLRGHLLEVYQLLQNAYSKEDTFDVTFNVPLDKIDLNTPDW